MSVSDKLITEEIGQAISLLEGVLNRLQAMTQPTALSSMPEGTFVPTDTPFLELVTKPTTLEDVRAALTELAGVKGAAAPKSILAKHGVKKLSELAPANFGAVLMAAHFTRAAQTEASAND